MGVKSHNYLDGIIFRLSKDITLFLVVGRSGEFCRTEYARLSIRIAIRLRGRNGELDRIRPIGHSEPFRMAFVKDQLIFILNSMHRLTVIVVTRQDEVRSDITDTVGFAAAHAR